jgi:hypothetical protein
LHLETLKPCKRCAPQTPAAARMLKVKMVKVVVRHEGALLVWPGGPVQLGEPGRAKPGLKPKALPSHPGVPGVVSALLEPCAGTTRTHGSEGRGSAMLPPYPTKRCERTAQRPLG